MLWNFAGTFDYRIGGSRLLSALGEVVSLYEELLSMLYISTWVYSKRVPENC